MHLSRHNADCNKNMLIIAGKLGALFCTYRSIYPLPHFMYPVQGLPLSYFMQVLNQNYVAVKLSVDRGNTRLRYYPILIKLCLPQQ